MGDLFRLYKFTFKDLYQHGLMDAYFILWSIIDTTLFCCLDFFCNLWALRVLSVVSYVPLIYTAQCVLLLFIN